MAYRINKTNPLDLQARKAVGVNIPFSADEVFTSNYQTKDAVKNNILNFLLTGKGERFMNPTFGSNIRNFLFEALTDAKVEIAQVTLSQELETYFPQIVVNELSISPVHDRNAVNITFAYQLRFTNIEDTVSINFI